MPWDSTRPTASDKLRISAGLITQNWQALETGGVPYQYLKLSERGANPTRANDFGWLYTKQADSQTELFYEDDRNPAKVTQLTNNGGIGITTQLLYGSAVITSGTYQNTQNAFCSAWALVSSGGALTAGFGVTVAYVSTGLYTVTFSTPLSSANYSVVATAIDTSSPGHNRVAMVVTQTANNFRVRTQRVDQSSGSFIDCGFSVAVFGGR